MVERRTTSLRNSIGSGERVTGERVIENPLFQPLLNPTLMAATVRNEEKGRRRVESSRINRTRGSLKRRVSAPREKKADQLRLTGEKKKKEKARRRPRYVLETRFHEKLILWIAVTLKPGGSQIPAFPNDETRRYSIKFENLEILTASSTFFSKCGLNFPSVSQPEKFHERSRSN